MALINKGKADGYGCLCLFGPGGLTDRIKFAFGSDPKRRHRAVQDGSWHDIKLLEVLWVADINVAERLHSESCRILTRASKRIRGDWFMVPYKWAIQTVQVASENVKVPILSIGNRPTRG